MPVKYIKGYKVELKKLTERFGAPKDDPHNITFLSVVGLFPRGAYKYVGGGFEEDGSLSLVMVLEDGDDKAKPGELAHARVQSDGLRSNFDCRRLEKLLDRDFLLCPY